MAITNHLMQSTEREKDVLNYWKTLVKESSTKKLIDSWQRLFQDKESRYAYIDDFLDSYLGMQIRVLREQRGWTQSELGTRAKMAQERVSILESMDYSVWSLAVLRKLARAFDVRLVVRFEDFGSYLTDYFEFDREHLKRRSFKDDIIFSDAARTNGLSQMKMDASSRKRKRDRLFQFDNDAPLLSFMYPLGVVSSGTTDSSEYHDQSQTTYNSQETLINVANMHSSEYALAA